MIKRLGYLVFLVFVLGWVCHDVYSSLADDLSHMEWKRSDDLMQAFSTGEAKDRPSPSDRIKQEQIHVYRDKVVMDIKDAEWSRFTDTKSMDPVIDSEANAIHIVPHSSDEIDIGDIVAYESRFTSGTIIHRVIEKGIDDEGPYFILKGDNNPNPDPGKVRFSQVRRVLVAIIY